VETLRDRRIALALMDHVWLPRPKQVFESFDPITTDFTYVCWIGDRKSIEQETKTWDRVIVDRSADLAEWVEVLKTAHKRKIQILAFANGGRDTERSSGGARVAVAEPESIVVTRKSGLGDCRN
jgi:hypothetical protein